ncbi:MAG: hypothetical protein QF807_01710 [Candidatus Thalassarchaeaceae archaeon]|jgi:hypothetical protein|nr:hypothetical protein [Candidatus Thalassarchaeaceae archaeon]MDP7042718.1 hypothetical protein [Candidatus Thalassarchaeaceae archaeon]
MLNSANTNPFHTFTIVRGDISDQYIEALEKATGGDDSELLALINSDSKLAKNLELQECNITEGRSQCSKNDSALLMVGLTPLNDNGERIHFPSDSKVRERLGRYPWGDGNPLSYLRTWSGNPPDSPEDIMILLDKLDEGLSEKIRGHDRFEKSSFGTLHGLLNSDETETLERLLSSGSFKVRADEPLDGGVADIMRHLKIIVRNAVKNGVGLLHYSH